MKTVEIGIQIGSIIRGIPASLYSGVLTASPQSNKFIFLRRYDHTVYLLLFWHLIKWRELKLYLAAKLSIISFSLILDGKMLTSHRLRQIAVGKTVELIGHREAVFFRKCDGAVTIVSLVPSVTLGQAKVAACIPSSCKLFQEWKELKESMTLKEFREKDSSVVECVPQSYILIAIMRTEMDDIYTSLPENSLGTTYITEKLQLIECDSQLQPWFFSTFPHYYGGKRCIGSPCDSISPCKVSLALYPYEVYITLTDSSEMSLPLLMTKEDSVGRLRMMIAQRIDALPASLKLLSNNTLLQDDSLPLSAYGANLFWNLLVLREGYILVHFTAQSITTHHAVNPNNSINDIRMKLSTHSNLLFNNQIMRKDETISSYTSDKEIEIKRLGSKDLIILVSSITGALCTAVIRKVKISHSFLRSKFEEVINDCQIIHWVGELLDSLSLKDYGLKDDSTLFVIYDPRHTSQNEEIYVNCFESKPIFQIVRSNSVIYFLKEIVSLQELKLLIRERFEVPEIMQEFWIRGQPLQNDLGLLKPPETIELRINTLFVCVRTVTKFTAVARPSKLLRVGEWKRKIERVVKMPAAQQRMLCNEREMSNEETLEDVGDEVVVLGSNDIRLYASSALFKYPIYCSRPDLISQVKKKVRKAGFHSASLRLMADLIIDSEKSHVIFQEQRMLRLMVSNS